MVKVVALVTVTIDGEQTWLVQVLTMNVVGYGHVVTKSVVLIATVVVFP